MNLIGNMTQQASAFLQPWVKSAGDTANNFSTIVTNTALWPQISSVLPEDVPKSALLKMGIAALATVAVGIGLSIRSAFSQSRMLNVESKQIIPTLPEPSEHIPTPLEPSKPTPLKPSEPLNYPDILHTINGNGETTSSSDIIVQFKELFPRNSKIKNLDDRGTTSEVKAARDKMFKSKMATAAAMRGIKPNVNEKNHTIIENNRNRTSSTKQAWRP